MMGKGYFVDLNNWEVITISEHFDAVRANPARYRIKKGAIPKNRDKALTQVLRRGFVRVREEIRSGTWHMEGACSWTDMYAAGVVLGKKLHLPAHAYFYLVTLNDLKRSPQEKTLRELMQEVGVGERRKINLAVKKLIEKSDRTFQSKLDEAIERVFGKRAV